MQLKSNAYEKPPKKEALRTVLELRCGDLNI